jgi:hypothetical protein
MRRRRFAIGVAAVLPGQQPGFQLAEAARAATLPIAVRGGERRLIVLGRGGVRRRKCLVGDFNLFRLFLNQLAFLPHENGFSSTENDTTALGPASSTCGDARPRAGENSILPEISRPGGRPIQLVEGVTRSGALPCA